MISPVTTAREDDDTDHEIDAPLPFIIDVGAADAGQRVDRVLAAHIPELSRARLQALIKIGAVRQQQGLVRDPSGKVKLGDRLVVEVPDAVAASPLPEIIPLDIVHEDAHLIVINKPAGLVVHPGNGNATGTLVNALIAHCGDSLSGIGGVKRPGIVHRLDKDTSGLLVAAKTDRAHAGLSEQFARHGLDGRLEREYTAIVWGCPLRPRDSVVASLGRSPTNRTRMAVVRAEQGRHATTHYDVVESFGGSGTKAVASTLRVQLETGRTHQIRVHMAHIGHPLMGDGVYGSGFSASKSKLSTDAAAALEALDRQALHAAVLGFVHPVTSKALRFERPWPADLAALHAALTKM